MNLFKKPLEILLAFSFLFYIVFFNLLNNLLRAIFHQKPQIAIVLRYCKTGLPNAISNKLLLVTLLVLITKSGLYLLSIYAAKFSKNKFNQFFSSLLVTFTIVELYSVAIFIFDKMFGTTYFKYFASTLYFYALGIQIGQLYLVIILNIVISVLMSFLLLKKMNNLNQPFILKLWLYTTFSIILLIIISQFV
jgi:hypothetical protein